MPTLAIHPPRHVVIIGAGIVGLSTAWFLQEMGVAVTVVDRDGIAAGASWGNAGWLSPGLAVPLPEPSVLRYGLQALFDPAAALSVPPTLDPRLWGFLARFALHCTRRQWQRSMRGYLPVNRAALDAYDDLSRGGISVPTITAPIVAVFEDSGQAAGLRHELDLLDRVGQRVDVTALSGSSVQSAAPQIVERMRFALLIAGQRYIDPGAFVACLAEAVVARGGEIRAGFWARTLRHGRGGITVGDYGGTPEHGDAVVVATGAWLNDLARPLGVRVSVRAGRGYSFFVDTDQPVPSPIYFPATRVACTPYQGGLRVGGTMEFRSPDAPIDTARVASLVNAARPLLGGVDWSEPRDIWVGSRPVTADGLPLVGNTKLPGVWVAGGHGMWGVTLGPITGRLLAGQIVTGKRTVALDAFDPLR